MVDQEEGIEPPGRQGRQEGGGRRGSSADGRRSEDQEGGISEVGTGERRGGPARRRDRLPFTSPLTTPTHLSSSAFIGVICGPLCFLLSLLACLAPWRFAPLP